MGVERKAWKRLIMQLWKFKSLKCCWFCREQTSWQGKKEKKREWTKMYANLFELSWAGIPCQVGNNWCSELACQLCLLSSALKLMGLEFGMEMEKLRSREAYSMITSKLVWTRDKFHFSVFTNSLLNKMVINFYVLCLAWKTGLEAKASAVTLSH